MYIARYLTCTKKLPWLLFLILFIPVIACSQLLQGKWKGSCSIEYPGMQHVVSIQTNLEFILSNDSSYAVYMYERGHTSINDTIVTIKVYYQRLAHDSIYLEQTEIIHPANARDKCLKKMFLKIQTRGSRIRLTGEWEIIGIGCVGSGSVVFWQKRKKGKELHHIN